MRYAIYVIVIANVIIGFVMLFGSRGPLKGKTFRDHIKKHL